MKYGTGFIINNNKGEYLLQKRSVDYTKHKGKWTLFGGGIKENEIPKDTAIREIKEELNLSIKNPKFVTKKYFKNIDTEIYFFKLSLNDVSKITLREGCGFAFFTIKEMEKLNMNKSNLEVILKYG